MKDTSSLGNAVVPPPEKVEEGILKWRLAYSLCVFLNHYYLRIRLITNSIYSLTIK